MADPRGTIDVKYDEPKLGGSDVSVMLETIFGHLNMVSGTPTWTPKTFRDGLALEISSGAIYYYDYTNNVWRSVNAQTASSPALYGDGSDGAVVLDGTNTFSFLTKVSSTYSLQRDTYFTDVTISSGCTLNPNGYMIFVSGTLTRNGTGLISFNGNGGGTGGAGGNGAHSASASGGTAGSAGAAVAAGTVPAAPAGKAGGAGGAADPSSSSSGNNGTNGGTATNGLGSDGSAGGTGGSGGNSQFSGASAGTAGTGGSANITSLIPHDLFPLRTLANWISGVWTRYGANGGSGGGSGGGGGSRNGTDSGGGGGGGGGSGSSGGFIFVFAKTIVASNTNALCQASGGAGGNGGNGGQGSTNAGNEGGGGGGGGGGAGGPGGIIVLVYSSCDQTVTSIISVAGGTAGALGAGGASGGGSAQAGNNGIAGTGGVTGKSYVLCMQ